VPESSKWHLLEFKTSNDKGFRALKKEGVEQNKPQHYAQMQVGMELAGLNRAMYLAVNKNSDEMYGERLHRDEQHAQSLLDRAEKVVFSEEPLERISDRSDWFECKFCDMHALCHGTKVAEVNCRTCVHSTPERDGTWSCAKHGTTLSTEEQRKGCDRHLMRPSLVPGHEATDAGVDWVEYDSVWYNHCDGVAGGRHCYTSAEMRAADQLPLEDAAEDIRQGFDGEVKR